MQTTMENYLRKVQRSLRRWCLQPGVRTGLGIGVLGGGGFLLSAAGLLGGPQPIAAGLVCAMTGWRAMVTAMGAAVGFWLLWGASGTGMLISTLGAFLLALLLGKRERFRQMPLLMPALLGVVTGVSETSLLFFRRERVGFPLFFLRVCLAPVSALFFRKAVFRRTALSDRICAAIGVLALAQMPGLSRLGLGYAAAGMMAVWGDFPGAALTALGLELAQVTRLPMTALVCIGWFARLLLPGENRLRFLAPGAAWLVVCLLLGQWDVIPLPGLLLGGFLGVLLPPRRNAFHRTGEMGAVQVRLELTAGILAHTQQLLLETRQPEMDEGVFLSLAEDRACGDCPSRDQCQERSRMTVRHLWEPASFVCRKSDRVHRELLLARDRLRTLKADAARRQEYRRAVIQQYQFLSDYLQQLSDRIPRRGERLRGAYSLKVSVRSRSRRAANGDRCLAFPGPECRYYVLLCDGMGTGLAAAEEGQTSAELLREMLRAGFLPEQAFRTVNSLLILRDRPGAVTLDLAEIRLDSGQVNLFKWGAAPSWLLQRGETEKIGTAMPPPGISLSENRETVARLSLCRGEVLILVSDGVQVGEYLSRGESLPVLPPGELAQWLLEKCTAGSEDDATVAVLGLNRRQPST